MDSDVRRELTVALGNVLLLRLVAEALKAGKLTSAEFEVVARCMETLLQTYEAAHPVTDAPAIPGGNGTVN